MTVRYAYQHEYDELIDECNKSNAKQDAFQIEALERVKWLLDCKDEVDDENDNLVRKAEQVQEKCNDLLHGHNEAFKIYKNMKDKCEKEKKARKKRNIEDQS